MATLSGTSRIAEHPIHSLLNCWPELPLPNLIAFKNMGLWKRNQFKQSNYQVPNKALLVKNLRKHDPLSRCHIAPLLPPRFFFFFFDNIAFSLINTSLKEDLSKKVGAKDETILIVFSYWIIVLQLLYRKFYKIFRMNTQ